MAILEIRNSRRQEGSFLLEKERVLVGRDKGVDLMLPNIAVSRRHAMFRCSGSRCAITDLDSTNGTLVNGRNVTRHVLKHGDVVRIGPFRLKYHNEYECGSLELARLLNLPPHSPLNTRDPSSTFMMSREMLQAVVKAEAAVKSALLVRKGRSGESWRPGTTGLCIGPRGEVPVDIAFTRASVARLTWDGKRYVLEKLSWFGRVMINGKSIKRAVLRSGDLIQVGLDRFTFEYERPAPALAKEPARVTGAEDISAFSTLPSNGHVEMDPSSARSGQDSLATAC